MTPKVNFSWKKLKMTSHQWLVNSQDLHRAWGNPPPPETFPNQGLPLHSLSNQCHHLYVCAPATLNRYPRISDAGVYIYIYREREREREMYIIYIYIGVRDCPYGICCPWVRGGWGLDALGKFFRRRHRRRRRPRPLLFRQFLEKVVIFSYFSTKTDILWHFF